jgi:predicted transcriptional regulator
MSANPSATTSITIRIPAEIAEQMRRLAKQHDRSLNGEIVRALREFVAKQQEVQRPSNRE